MLKHFQKVLNKAQILLTPNKEHKTVLGEKPPIIGCSKPRTLEDYLLRTKIPNKDTNESSSAQCNRKRCQVCQYIEKACQFKDTDVNKYNIRKGVINCNIDFSFYKFHCSSCSKLYLGSNITDFCYRFNNYKSALHKVSK